MPSRRKPTPKPAKRATARAKATTGFTAEERAAMRERARELKAEARSGSRPAKQDGERAVRAAIAAMPDPDRALGERVFAVITAAAPDLVPKTWYGMPAWANADGKVVCFFQGASKFKARYATVGFSDVARLDDGAMWPTAFALQRLTAAEESRIAALVTQAVRRGAVRPS